MDGGQIKGGVVVEVERIDVYDFKVVVSEKEFHQIALLADKLGVTFEQALAEVIGIGFVESGVIIQRKD